MAPTLPRPTFGAALSSSSSSSSASPKPHIITLSSSGGAAGSKPDVINLSSDGVITLSSSSDGEQEASSWKGLSSAGSKDGPAVLTSSDYDSEGQLPAKRQKRGPPRNVAWLFSDEIKILTALADERLQSGRLPRSRPAILDAIRNRVHLQRQNATAGDLTKKVHHLKEKFKKVIASDGPSGELRERKLYHLSEKVWPELLPPLSSSSSG